MLNWIEDAHKILNNLRGSFLDYEENLVLLEFCTGKGTSTANIAEIRDCLKSYEQQYLNSNSEDGKVTIVQDIVNLYSYIKNARRVL